MKIFINDREILGVLIESKINNFIYSKFYPKTNFLSYSCG